MERAIRSLAHVHLAAICERHLHLDAKCPEALFLVEAGEFRQLELTIEAWCPRWPCHWHVFPVERLAFCHLSRTPRLEQQRDAVRRVPQLVDLLHLHFGILECAPVVMVLGLVIFAQVLIEDLCKHLSRRRIDLGRVPVYNKPCNAGIPNLECVSF